MICTAIDDFICDATVWIAHLDNGLKVYQDDDRPGLTERVAWLRLKQYIHDNHCNITGLFLRFRSHELQVVPQNKDGYFFSKMCCATNISTDIVHCYLMGYLENDLVYISQWRVPELICVNRNYSVRPKEHALDNLIINAKKSNC